MVFSPADLQAEIAEAVESQRVLDMQGHALVSDRYRLSDGPCIAREDAYEAWRAAGGAAAGLVSVPSSGTPHSRARSNPFKPAAIAASAARCLGQVLHAFRPDPDLSRIAKLRQAVGFSARVHLTETPVTDRCCMVTLTYAGNNTAWQPRHISDFLKRVRQYMARRGLAFRYVWVAELQKRGVIHYHVALWLPDGFTLPKPDQIGWWPHGFTRIETARAAVPYLMKYLSKGCSASAFKLPQGARSYGMGGLDHFWKLARRWLSLPGFIKARADVGGSALWRRAVGGGWSDGDGVIWSSEFQRTSVGGVWMLQRVHDHGRPFDASGPFSFLRGGSCAAA